MKQSKQERYKDLRSSFAQEPYTSGCREKTYSYALCNYVLEPDSKEVVYCRAIHDVLKLDDARCEYCPLWNGLTGPGGMGCTYFDFFIDEKVTAHQRKRRISGLIQAGITAEFPHFLSQEEINNGGAIYEKALQFAAKAHEGSYRKGTDTPYIVHPITVSVLVREMLFEKQSLIGKDEYEIMAAAALHDVVEDTKYTKRDIENYFSTYIAELVAHESENKRPEMPAEQSWRTRKIEALDHLRHAPEEAKLICLADKLSNIMDLCKDYKKLGDACFAKFNVKDKSLHAWYYRSIAEILSCFSESRYYKQFCNCISEVFES